jgi:hypothetical protein
VLSSNTATIKPTVIGDENIVFKNALNCKDEYFGIKSKPQENKNEIKGALG